MITKGKLRRTCEDCGKKYIPTGKFQKYCNECQNKPEHLRGNFKPVKGQGRYYFQRKRLTTK